ncbi:MAG: cation diffusion facilitator CzcD-associated flavoprotein CzcO [Myxococcota bacterium]
MRAGGQTLNEAWAGGAEAYYGMAVSGFPNLFLMLGPNSGLGHNSMILMMEAQARYIRQCIARIQGEGLHSLDVKPAAQRAFNVRLQQRLAGAVWAGGCQSWYLDGEGRNTALWPGHVFEYQLRTRRPRRPDFRAHQTA